MLIALRGFGATKRFIKCFSTTQLSLSSSIAKKVFSKDIIIRNIDEAQRSPLMVIVGWSNSKNKQVAKYSQIYEQQGFTTVSVSCKMYRFSMFYDSLFADDTKACINALTSQRSINKDRKVFFKLFSTPGPAMYINIMNYYYQYIEGHFGTDQYQNANKEDIPNIAGVILDSPTVASGNAQQFANGMKGNSKKNVMTNYMFDVLGQIVYAYAVRNSKMHKYGPEFFRNMPVLIRQLILFSKVDKIASCDAILEYIKQQRSMGALVDYHMWDQSPHVLHYRYNNEEYLKVVTAFLESCITSQDGDDSIPMKSSSSSRQGNSTHEIEYGETQKLKQKLTP